MFQVTKTFTFKNRNSSEHIWDLAFAQKETYLPSLPEKIKTVDQLILRVKELSLQLANSGKLLSKFTELYDSSSSVIKMNFLDESSWNEYVELFKTNLGYDPSIAIDINECVFESIDFNNVVYPSELTVYNPVLYS